MRIRRFNRKAARIEMLPLIDIVFLLLVFFIYAMMSMAVHNGLQLDLPESTQASTSQESPLSLFVRPADEGVELQLNDVPVSLDSLSFSLQNSVTGGDSKKILVFAEENVSYQQLYLVLDQLKRSGIDTISLQANRE